MEDNCRIITCFFSDINRCLEGFNTFVPKTLYGNTAWNTSAAEFDVSAVSLDTYKSKLVIIDAIQTTSLGDGTPQGALCLFNAKGITIISKNTEIASVTYNANTNKITVSTSHVMSAIVVSFMKIQ